MAGKQSNSPMLFDQDGDNIEVIDFFNADSGNTSTDAQSKAEAFASALKDDPESFVTIHRVMGAGNMPEQYCTRFPSDKFDVGQMQQMLSETFGAGDYRVRIYIKGKLRGNKLLSIAGKISHKDLPNPTGEAASILETVLARMEAQNRQIMQLMAQQNQPQQSRKEMLEEMLMYKQLFGGDQKSGGLGELTSAIEALKTLGVKIGGEVIEHEKEEGFGDLIEKMTPLIGAAINAPQQTSKIDPELARKKQMNMVQKIAIKTQIAPFIKAASKNSDPSIYAEMLIDQIGETTATQYANNPAIINELATHIPDIAPHREWFNLLIEHAKAQLGIPSSVSHLYESSDSDINSESESGPDIDNE